jgi:hypothetical protein
MSHRVGLAILWGLSSFGIDDDFVACREAERLSARDESCLLAVEGVLLKQLEGASWLFDDGSRSLVALLPEGSSPPLGMPLRLHGRLYRMAHLDYLDVEQFTWQPVMVA